MQDFRSDGGKWNPKTDSLAFMHLFIQAFDYPSWADFARRLRHSSWAVRDKTELTAAEIEGLLGPLFGACDAMGSPADCVFHCLIHCRACAPR